MIASDDNDSTPAMPEPGGLLAKVAGRVRSRTVALKEFEEGVAELRRRMEPAFWPLFIPKAEDTFRWRVQLECGCVHEVLTNGRDRFPDEGTRADPISRYRLPAGEYWCPGGHDTAKPYRDIVEWIEQKVREFPSDPEEPRETLINGPVGA